MTKIETTKHTNDTKRRLPEDWHWVRLGEVIEEAQAGFACGLRDPQGIAQLRMNNLDTRGNFVWDDVIRVPHEANDTEQFLIVPGDVLFNNTNSTELVGKSALFEGYVEPIVYSNHFTRLRTVTQALLPDFLASWLNHQWQQRVFAAICNRWIGQSAVKADKLLNLDFPLPPLSEQRRIAAVLREQMAAVEKARAATQARLEAVKILPASLLRQVFPQPGQSLPAGWRWVKLEEVCRQDRQIVESLSNEAGTITYLSLEHIETETGRILKAPIEQVEDEGKSTTFRFDERHVLYGKLRPYLNKVALPNAPGRCTTEMIPLLPLEDVDREFLAWLLRRHETVDFAMQGKTGSRMPRADMDSLLNLPVPLLLLSEQKRIAAVLRDQMAAVEQGRGAVEEELQTINALPAALLRRAFNGELL